MRTLFSLGAALLSCQALPASATEGKPLPALPFRLELTEPLQEKSVLAVMESKGRYELRLRSKAGRAKGATSGRFSREVVGELFAILAAGDDPLGKWKPDSDCALRRNFLLISGAHRLRICSDKSRVSKLDDFRSAAQLILRDERGGRK